MLIMVTQEIKRDIIYERMNLPLSGQQVANPQHLVFHLDQVFWHVIQHIVLQKYKQAIIELQEIQEIIINEENQEQT
jgi:hypothetical protein